MPEKKQHKKQDDNKSANLPLAFFTCPNSNCADFNKFGAGNLSIAEKIVWNQVSSVASSGLFNVLYATTRIVAIAACGM